MKIRFVRDEAAGSDAFGGHQPIAKTLASLIDDSPEVRTIGLIGPWGSGKSTVVSLASNEFRTPVLTYTFDAWAHQGDLPRKAIIEGLIEFLDQNGVPKKRWEKKLDELTRRVETHEIQSTPTLTPWGVAIAMSLLLLPLGIRLSAASDASAAIGWLMTFMPFGLALGNWWWWRPTRNPLAIGAFHKQNFVENRAPHVGKSIVSIFVNKATDKTTNRIAKSPEPSSLEFRDFFKEVIGSIEGSAEKILVVIDNLDRVSEADAANIWSTVRSLFSWPDMEIEKSRLKVIIPLDYVSLYRFLDQKDNISDQDKLRTQSLIDKTFDVVLRVVPPVATDWQRYLADKLQYSLGDDYDTTKLHFARVMFQHSMEELGKTNSITPRSLNSYVNSIGALYMQRSDEVPFVAICYYSSRLSRGEEFDIGRILLKSESDTPIQRYLPEWRTSVAALHFGVPETHALQLLLSDKIVESVKAGDAKTFGDLLAVPGFESVLESVVQSDQARSNSFIANLAGLLSEAKLTEATATDVWNSIAQAALRFSSWDKLDSLTATGLKAIIEKNDALVRTSIIKSLSGPQPDLATTGAAWVENAAAATIGPDGKRVGLNILRVPTTAEFYLTVIDASTDGNLDEEFRAGLLPNAKPSAIIQHLAQAATAESFGATTLSRIDALKQTRVKWPWTEMVDTAVGSVQNDTGDGHTSGALRVLLRLSEAASTQITTLGQQGYLADAFRNAVQSRNESQGAVTLVAIGAFWPDLSLHSHVRNSGEGQNLMTNLGSLPEDFRDALATNVVREWSSHSADTIKGLLLIAQSYPSSSTYLLSIIAEALRTEQVPLLNVPSVTDRFDFLFDHEQRVSGRRILIYTTGFRDFWAQRSTGLSDEQFGRLISILPSASLTQGTASALESRLSRLSPDQWVDVLTIGAGLVRSFRKIAAAGYQIDLGPALPPAMKALGKAIADRSAEPSEQVPWKQLFSSLGPDNARSVAADMADSILTLSNGERESYLRFFEDEFWQVPAIITFGDRFTRALIEPLLVDGHDASIRLITSKSTALSKIIAKASRKTRADIFRHLTTLQNDGKIEAEAARLLETAWSRGRNDGSKPS